MVLHYSSFTRATLFLVTVLTSQFVAVMSAAANNNSNNNVLLQQPTALAEAASSNIRKLDEHNGDGPDERDAYGK